MPGAIARDPLTLVLRGLVTTPGDADLNGIIDLDDYSHIDNGNNGLNWPDRAERDVAATDIHG